MPSVFDQIEARGFDRGLARGELMGKAEYVIQTLKIRLKQVPQDVQRRIKDIRDPIALNSLLVSAILCQSMEDFLRDFK